MTQITGNTRAKAQRAERKLKDHQTFIKDVDLGTLTPKDRKILEILDDLVTITRALVINETLDND